MKKYIFTLLIGALLLSSCSKYNETSSLDGYDFSFPSETETSENGSEASSDSSDDSSDEESQMYDFSALTQEELSQYITLGEYKGLESEKYVVEITDKDVETQIEGILKSNSEFVVVEDRAAKEGDTVTIDYVGYVDGETFDGGSATDAELVIGDKKFIDGFEEGLIGVKTNEKVSLNLKFPDNYYEHLAGKDVVFEVTVKKIEMEVVPTLTDEFVDVYTEGEIKTVDLFKEDIKNKLFEQKERELLNVSKNNYWEEILSNATVIKYPDGIVDDYINSYIDYYTQMAAMYGATLEEFLGKPVDEFKEELKKDAEASYKTQMVLYAAIYAEGFDKNISDDKYTKWLKDFSQLLGVSKEQLVEKYSTETLKSTCLFDLFLEHVYQYRTEVEPDTSEDTESSVDSADSSVDESSVDAADGSTDASSADATESTDGEA